VAHYAKVTIHCCDGKIHKRETREKDARESLELANGEAEWPVTHHKDRYGPRCYQDGESNVGNR
jgi:hypothetical protein